jgi:DNA-binding transcriptional MocR family regulator
MSSVKAMQIRYPSIARIIRSRIENGDYTPGEKIPSIRQFAEEFACNKLTVQRAFDRLKLDGLIENRIGSGSFVRFPETIQTPSGIFDFRTDYLHESLFPYEHIQDIFNRLFAQEKARALAPTPAQGDPDLIRVLSQYYHVPPERMVMISGAQQGLDLVAKVFSADISESMLFEDPTYPGAISLFKARHFVPLDEQGPDLDQLARKLDGGKRLFYTMPSVHNPTGIGYSDHRKAAVAQYAQQYHFYIIEDDFLSEFRNPTGPRFVDLCPANTIHIKSLSQTTVAGIRLGFMVVPRDLYDRFLYAKFTSDIASFGLMQRCMRDFFKNGLYRRHLDNVSRIISRRKQSLLRIIEAVDHLAVNRQQAGFSLWVKSHKPLPDHNVPWSRGEEFSFSPEARTCFRLSFMNLDDRTFKQGVAYLNTLLV